MKMIIEKAENGFIVTHEGDTKYVYKSDQELIKAEFAWVTEDLEDYDGKMEVTAVGTEVSD